MTDEEKWRQLMDYFERWPYSPYRDIELRELADVVRKIRDQK